MKRRTVGLVLALMLIAAQAGAPHHRADAGFSYTIDEIGTLGGPRTFPHDINDNGQVSGSSDPAATGHTHGFLWSNGEITDLGTTGDFEGNLGLGINDSGQVAGTLLGLVGDPLRLQAYIWENGAIRVLSELPSRDSIGRDINNSGQVVGDLILDGISKAFVLDSSTGAITQLEGSAGQGSTAVAINDLGAAVGTADVDPTIDIDAHAYLWHSGSATDLGVLPGDSTSTAYAISNQGIVAGTSRSRTNEQHAFRWQAGVLEALPALGGTQSEARSVNDLGQIVGYASTATGESRAVLWQDDAVIDLNSLLPDDAGLVLRQAAAINDRGQIAALAEIPGSQYLQAVVLTPSADQMPPELLLPVSLTVNADGPDGAVVTYDATATDDADPSPDVSCAPPSGETFAIGVTTVSCTATDAAGNTISGTFRVTVQGASEQLGDLIDLVESFNLKQGIANALDAKLDNARDALAAADAGDTGAACGLLGAFINHVEAQTGKHLAVDQSAQLIEAAEQIRAVLSC